MKHRLIVTLDFPDVGDGYEPYQSAEFCREKLYELIRVNSGLSVGVKVEKADAPERVPTRA